MRGRRQTCSVPPWWPLKAKTGEYAWHFQQVHHDIWDYDAASPGCLVRHCDRRPNRERASPRPGAPAGSTSLIATNGKPLIGINEKGRLPQEPRQKDGGNQRSRFPSADPVVPQCAEKIPGYDEGRLSLYAVLGRPRSWFSLRVIGGTNWSADAV